MPVFVQQPVQPGAPNGPVQRAHHADLHARKLVQCGLDLRAVFAHDIAVVAPRIRHPAALKVDLVVEQVAVQCAEAAEGVGGKKDMLVLFISHHHFGPVDHRCKHKAQRMRTKAERIVFHHSDDAALQVEVIELAHQSKGFGVSHDFQLGKAQQQFLNVGAMVRLHMVDDKIVQMPSGERMHDVFQKLARDGGIHRVDKRGFFIQDQIGIVRDPAWDGEQIFKKGKAAVIAADPGNGVADSACAVHERQLLS